MIEFYSREAAEKAIIAFNYNRSAADTVLSWRTDICQIDAHFYVENANNAVMDVFWIFCVIFRLGKVVYEIPVQLSSMVMA